MPGDYYFPIGIKKERKRTKCREEYTRGGSWGWDSPTRTLRHYSGISGNFPVAYTTTNWKRGVTEPLFISSSSPRLSLHLVSFCLFISPIHLHPILLNLSPSLFLYLSLFPALTTYDSRQATALSHPLTHRVLIPSYHPRRERPRLALSNMNVCVHVYAHVGARRHICVCI